MEYNYAGFWVRVGASVLDTLIILPVIYGIDFLIYKALKPFDMTYIEYLLSPDTVGMEWSTYNTLSILCTMLFVLIYYSVLTSSKQATFGKMAFGLKVVGENGEGVSFGRSVARYLSYCLSSILYVGLIMVAFTPKKQALHDYICKTYVVHKQTTSKELP